MYSHSISHLQIYTSIIHFLPSITNYIQYSQYNPRLIPKENIVLYIVPG